MRIYETLWQVACIPKPARGGRTARLTARQAAVLWTFTEGQRDAQYIEARRTCSRALHACITVLQALQQGRRQATYISLTAAQDLLCERSPPLLCVIQRLPYIFELLAQKSDKGHRPRQPALLDRYLCMLCVSVA